MRFRRCSSRAVLPLATVFVAAARLSSHFSQQLATAIIFRSALAKHGDQYVTLGSSWSKTDAMLAPCLDASVLAAAVFCLVQTAVVTSLPTGDGLNCPRLCFCNSPSRIVYCSRRGLAAIPSGVPVNSLQLNLNGNVFESPVMRRANLSSFVHLEHLYLSECRLQVLEVGAFVDLVALRWLDLSNNRLRTVEPDTFHGLRLQHLFLNGNRHIQLSARSFAGLITVGLYLHDCSLTEISADILSPLNTTLRNLWLNGNELDRLEAPLAQYFAPLHHIRLGSNPMRCDCGAAWLRAFYDQHIDTFRGALPPSCFRPARLRGRPLGDVDPADLRCRPPSFTALEVRFDAPLSAGGRVLHRRLRCAAVGDPTPTLYWIQPSGQTTRYERPTRDSGNDVEQVDAVLQLSNDRDSDESDETIAGVYTCIANNNVGNVTMTVVIPAQRRHPAAGLRHAPVDGHRLTDVATTTTRTSTMMISEPSTPASLQSILLGDSLLQLQRLAASNAPSPPPYSWLAGQDNLSSTAEHDRQEPVLRTRARFSSAEMACAVVLTHIATLVLCVAALLLYRYRRRLGFAVLTGKTRHRPRRYSYPGIDGSGTWRAAYERRFPWTASVGGRGAGGVGEREEKTAMSLDRGTSSAGETVSFKRGVRQYTINDYCTAADTIR